MSAETKYTDRDLALAQRAAFVRGVQELHVQCEIPPGPAVARAVDRVESRARILYPLPTVTRPRVVWMQSPVTDITFRYRVVGGVVEWANVNDDDWEPHGAFTQKHMTPEFIRVLANLLANPTEEVEA